MWLCLSFVVSLSPCHCLPPHLICSSLLVWIFDGGDVVRLVRSIRSFSFLATLGTTVTSVGTTIAVTGNDVFQGTCIQFADGGTTAAFYEAAGTNRITLDGSTKGGIIGDSIELIDMKADTWFVRILQSATGSEASPFSTV